MFVLLAAIVLAIAVRQLYLRVDSSLRAERAESQTFREVVASRLQYPGRIATTDSFDVIADSEVRRELNGHLSLVATISSFGRVGASEPTVLLGIGDVDVLRPETVIDFDISGTKVFKHDVVEVAAVDTEAKSASLAIVIRHSDLFHGQRSKRLFEDLENIIGCMRRLIGADLSVGVYIATSSNPGPQHWVGSGSDRVLPVRNLGHLDLAELRNRANQHDHPRQGDKEALRPHVEYLLTSSQAMSRADQSFVAVLLPDATLDPGLKRDDNFHQFIQFYRTDAAPSPERAAEFARYGLTQWESAITDARKSNALTANIRVWASNFAEGYQAKYRIRWFAGEVEPHQQATFFLRLRYLHFDLPQSPVLSVLYAGAAPP